jgi:holin-like protein
MQAFLKSIAQVLFFIVISGSMNLLVQLFRLPIPGSLLGLGLVFLLLQLRLIKLEWIDLGAKWLLAEMLLFFIPPAAGMMEYKAVLLASGLRILLVVIFSTLIVMICAGLLTERFANRQERKPF